MKYKKQCEIKRNKLTHFLTLQEPPIHVVSYTATTTPTQGLNTTETIAKERAGKRSKKNVKEKRDKGYSIKS